MQVTSPKLKPLDRTREIGWSNFRNNNFEWCKRKYYYIHYQWADKENSDRYRFFKDLTSIPLEVGNVVDDIVRRILKYLQLTARLPDLQRVATAIDEEVRLIKANRTFASVYYRELEEINFEDDIAHPVRVGVKTFLESPILQWILEEGLVTKERWIVELKGPHEYGECRIGGTRAFGKVDALIPIDDEIHIIDWKTGSQGKYTKFDMQLKAYAWWAKYHLDAEISKIRTKIVYLFPEYSEHSFQFNDYDLTEFADFVRIQRRSMESYCEVPELNRPKSIDAFPMAQSPNLCKRCEFRELCGMVPMIETSDLMSKRFFDEDRSTEAMVSEICFVHRIEFNLERVD